MNYTNNYNFQNGLSSNVCLIKTFVKLLFEMNKKICLNKFNKKH